MRKKFLLMLTLLILALGGGGNLFAQNVAKVGNIEYATIDEAIAAWTDKTTLTLLADVTLSDVIKLSSTEYHILDLGTYTMTAASGKDAIQYVVNGRSSASYALDIKADANNPGGIIATGKAIVVHEKPKENAPEKDRPITRFYGGVFEATDIVKQYGWERFMFVTFREGIGYSGAKAPYFYFYGGEFNGNISTNRSSVQFHGGTFNGFLNMSVDSSSWAMVEGGKFKYLSNLMGSNLDEKIDQGVNNYKFTIGSEKAKYNRGIYVDKDGYYVITSAPITEVSAKYPAVYKTTYDGDNYFYYSAAQEYGMFYEVASMAGTGSNVTVWPGNGVANELKSNEAFNYTPTLPEGVTNFEVEIKDIVIDDNNATTKVVFNVEPKDGNGDKVANPSSSITFRLPVPAAWANKFAYVDHDGTRLDDKYEVMGGNYVEVTSASFSEFAVELAPPVAKIGENEYYTLSAAFAAVTADGQTVVVCQDVTENLTGAYLRGNITTENDTEVTITLTNSDWVYCPYTFILDENITLNVPALFYYAGGAQINGKVVAGAYYQRYAGSKLTINEPGSMTVTSETCIIRYMDGDANAGIYIVGDNNDETVGLKLQVAYFYQGMINAKDANIVAGTYWQTNETDGQGTANLVLDNSTLTVTVYDHPAKATGNSTVTLINGSVFDAKNGGFTYGNNTEFSVDATSSITGKNGTVKLPVAKIGDTKYLTLEDAFAAATEGQTITLLADATPALTSQRAITKAAVIDLGGKTLTLKEDDLYFGTTTFQNGNIVVDPSVNVSTAVFWMFENQTLTFDKVAITATGVTGTYLIGLDGNNSDLNLINGSEILVENTTALDLDIICVNASTGNDIIVENSKVNVTNLDGRVFFRGNYTVKDSEVNLAGITKAGFRIEAGQTLSIEGTSKVNIEGEPRDGGIHLTDFTATYTKDDTATVNATLNRPYAAQIGENKYITFAEAAAVAQAGSEIKLLANIDGDITVPANVTLNGNGFAVSGAITAAGEITFAGVTKTGNFGVENTNTVVNIPGGASLQLTGTGRMVIGHGCTFNITGTIADAKNANVADVTPSLVMPGASFTGAGVTFNVTNAYIKATAYCSSKNSSANNTFNFNITNSIWEQTGSFVFTEPTSGKDPIFNLNFKDGVLNSTSHLVFAVKKGEIVFDNSNVNQGTSRQIENRSTMTIKNGSVVNGAVATSSNAINPGTIIVENATYAVTGEFSGAAEGTGTIIVKKGATVSAGSITKANITIDATDMAAGDDINLTANLSNLAGELSVINNDDLEAKIVDGKIVLALKPEAMIGETPYETLAAAFAAAQNGDVIIINRNVTTFPVINKAVTFKGGKENAAVEINVFLAQNFTAIDGTVKFENLTFNKPLFTEQGGTKPGLSIEFESCNFNVPSDQGYAILIGTSGSNSVVKGLKVNNCNFKYVSDVFKGGYMLYVQCVNEVTITNNTIDGNNLYRGAIHLGDATEHATVAIVSNNTIKNFCRGVMMGNRKAPSSANISGNIFDKINYSDMDSKPEQECAPIFIHSNATAEALEIALTDNKVTNCNNPMIYSEDTDLVADYVTEFTANTVDGTAVEFGNSCYNAPNELPVVAKIGDKGYQSLQAAINKVQNNQTITLVRDVTENVTLTEKVGLYYTIDGAINRANNTMNGKIVITPLSDENDNRRITIKNINFVNTADAAVDFISCAVTNHYPRLTVEGCTFTGNGKNTDVALRLKTAYGAVIKDCTGTGLHSFLQNTAGRNFAIEKVTVTNSKSGLSLGTVQGVTIKGSNIDVAGYGIRMDANTYNNNAVIESNTIKAFIPVVVRNVNTASNITFQGTNTFTATNTDGLWCAIGTSEYGENGQMPTAATGNVSVTLNDAGLNADGIYGNSINFEGSGTEESPYLINNLNDLKFFRNNVDKQAQDGSTQYAGKYFKLTADIDLAGINWNPIGSMSGDHGSFKGVFDGDNHTISNLKVEQAGDGIGLFARTTGNAVIKNLILNNVTVKSTSNSNHVGGVVGNAFASTKIENVHVTGDVQISGRGYIGGIVGHGYVVMDNVSVVANEDSFITSTFWCAGGILGYAGEGSTNIMNARVEGLDITSAAGGLGSIVGMAEDNNGTQPISGSNLSAENVDIKTYVGAYGTAYENYCIGYLYGGNKTSKLTGELKVENVVLENASGNFPSEVSDAVANINDKIYFNLASAIATIGNGDVTINLLRDVTLDYNARDEYGNEGTTSVTINGNNHTLTLNQKNSDWASIGLVNGKLVLNNMTIEKTGYGDTSGTWNTHAIIFSTDVVMNNVTVNNAIAVAADATLENVTINEANGYYGLWIEANGQTVTMNGGSITATNGGRGIKIADEYINNPAQVTLNVTETAFTTAKKAAVLVSSTAGAKITAVDVDITNVVADYVNFVWVDEDWAANYGNVEVTGATVAQEGIENFVAAISETQDEKTNIIAYYKTLPEAIAAVKEGEEIELINDITDTTVIELGKSVTINGNDHNVTSSATRVFRVTTSNTEVTLNDVNMVSSAKVVYPNDVRGISIDIVDNVKLTLNNSSVDFTDASANDWAYAVNVTGGDNHVVTVNGGTYEGANVINVRGANNTVTVKDAVITSTYPNNNQYYGACIWVEQKQNSTVEATGNTFNGSNAVAFNLGTGTALTESNNIDNTTRIIAEIDGKYYTLQEAIEAAGTTVTTITIMASFSTDDSYTIAAGQNITLNLNGMTITGTDKTEKSFGLINNKGTLTIVGNSNNRAQQGALKLSATVNSGWNRYSAVISNQPGGKLTVNGGTIEHLGGTDMAYAIDNLTNGKGTYAETEINGGTVKSPYRAIRQFLNGVEADNILTVKGGTIEGTNKSIWMQDPSKNANTGTLIVNANANLYGDVYLSVTEGSTEWPVEVAIVASAIKQGTVLTSNVPDGYDVANQEGVWGVYEIIDKAQSIDLVTGWKWVSLFVDATEEKDLESLQTQLGGNGVQIKSYDAATTQFEVNGQLGWYGSLESLSVEDMYMIKVKAPQTVSFDDHQVNPADYEFTLNKNWTWIGFPSSAALSIEYALGGITPVTGDVIKSQDAYAMYSQGIGWYGSLETMIPGEGYMYNNLSGAVKTLVYPAASNYRGEAPAANITAANNLMVPNMSKYANNMNITAVVNIDGEELMTEDFEVAVFAGEELRGSARPIYIESLNRYMLFITVYGEESEELTFKYYDLNSGEELNLFADSKVVFEVNSIVGSVEQPSVLNYGTLSIDETSANSFNVYPNPVNRDNAISFETTFDKVEVYNSLGVVVAEYNNVDKIDGIEAAGIYVIKVTNDNVVKYCRVIVK